MVVFFHGSIRAKPLSGQKTVLPVFYGQGKSDSLKGAHILQFSDRLLEYYSESELELSWFLDTNRIKQQDSIIEVTTFYKDKYQLEDIIFFGTSGGGYISLICASKTNQIAMFSNSQFILEQHSQFSDLIKILNENNDQLCEIDLYKNLSRLIGPKKVYNFCNTRDYTYKHHLHMSDCIEKLWPGRIESLYFDGNEYALARNIENHNVRFPGDEKSEQVLSKIL